MKPLDPRLLRRTGALRPFLALTTGLVLVDTAALILQVGLLAHALAGVVAEGWSASRVAGVAAWLVGATLLRATFSSVQTVAGRRAASVAAADLRHGLLAHLVDRPSERAPGEVGVLATRGVDAVEPYIAVFLPTLVAAAIVPVSIACAALVADRPSGVLLLVLLPLVPVFMVLVGRFSAARTASSWRSLERLAAHVLDVITGLPTLKLFGRDRVQAATIARLGERYRRSTMRALRAAFLSALVLELVATLSVAVIAVEVGLRLVDGRVSLATAFVVLLLAPECFAPLRRLGAAYHTATEGLEASGSIVDALDEALPASGTRPVPSSPRISCRGVRVRHDDRPDAPEHADVDVGPGSVVALVGPNGAGKSSLLGVLRRWVPAAGGRVTVDGVPLREIDLAAWTSTVAWVPQRPALGRGTARSVIGMGAPSATERQIAALARSLGLDTVLERPARELSAGERQRVALARAVLRVECGGARVALLDEPTANLDEVTEQAVVTTVRRMADAGAAVIVVAHRPALVAAADRVVRLGSTLREPAPLRDAGGSALPAAVGGARPSRGPAERGAADAVEAVSPWRWLWRSTRGVRGRLALSVLLAVGATSTGLALTGTSAWLLSRASEHPAVLELGVAVVLVRALALAKAFLRYGERLASHDAVLRFVNGLRVRVYERLAALSPAGLAGHAHGDLLTRTVGDLDALQDHVLRALLPPLVAAGAAIAVLVGATVLAPAVAAVLLVAMLLGGVVVPIVTGRADRRSGIDVAAARVSLAVDAVEIAETAEELAAYGAGASALEEVAAHERGLRAAVRRQARAGAAADACELAGAGLAAATLLLVAATLLRSGGLDVRFTATAVLLGWMVPDVVGSVPQAARQLMALRSAAARVTDVFETPLPVHEPARPFAAPRGPVAIACRGLAVRWPGAAAPVLRGLDLDVPAGSRIAVTGPSGAGKSTLAATLVRFLEPEAGSLRIGGVDARDLRPEDVRRLVGWCAQDAHFFDSTIADNLRIARPDATRQDLEAAVHEVGLSGWLAALPAGLDTRVGVGGARVSGGEAQRLALARELLADRPIVVLDEPTANVDPVAAELLTRDLLARAGGRTVVVITHRPVPWPWIDRAYRLESGRLVAIESPRHQVA